MTLCSEEWDRGMDFHGKRDIYRTLRKADVQMFALPHTWVTQIPVIPGDFKRLSGTCNHRQTSSE